MWQQKQRQCNTKDRFLMKGKPVEWDPLYYPTRESTLVNMVTNHPSEGLQHIGISSDSFSSHQCFHQHLPGTMLNVSVLACDPSCNASQQKQLVKTCFFNFSLSWVATTRVWSNSGTGFLERWAMPHACQCLRGILTMPLITCFNFWSALKSSGSWTRWLL